MSKKQKLEKEIRYIPFSEDMLKIEQREDGTEDLIVEGYAITYNNPTLIGSEDWGWIESIDPNALEGADTKDCCFKYNHGDAMGILGRTKNGSLSLNSDSYGCLTRNKLPNTTQGRDFYTLVKDGYIDKMSFAFTVAEEEIDYNSKPMRRVIKRIGKLFDVSGVDIPAYDSTSLLARSKEMAEAKSLLDAEAEKRALEEAEASNKLKDEKLQQRKKDVELDILKTMYRKN